jgi:O-antigen ligase
LPSLWIASPIAFHLERIQAAQMLRGALFIVVFLLVWISLDPFPNLGDATTIDVAAGRGLTYASFGLLAILSLALVAWRHAEALRSFISAPYILFGCWMCINLLMSRDPGGSMLRFVLTTSVFVVAATVLLLPETARELNAWLGVAVLSFLAVCYLGVLMTPDLAIHQATDASEHHLAGDWRGVFSHKNSASAVMAMLIFVGIYLTRSGAMLVGPLISALSAVFLLFAAGKSATGLCLVTLVIVELVVAFRGFWLRALLCFLPLIVLNLLGIGAVISPSLHAISGLLPFDTSFTGRDEVWGFAFESIAQRPVFGWGYLAFWGTSFLRDVVPGGAVNDWVVLASHSHNSYLDSALALGIPGLLLLMVILVFVPLRNFHLAAERDGTMPLAKMFLRIWLFGVYLASLESFFLDRTDPVWFTFLVAVIGLHYLSRFRTTS